MQVYDFSVEQNHEPHFMFMDRDYIYIVSEHAHESMLNTSGPNQRLALANIVINRDSDMVIKNRYS